MRAAASTCLSFLACHPLGARGDTCLTGPFRTRLLNVGAFGALLKAALASSSDAPCDAIIQQTAAVGIMYMATMVSGVGGMLVITLADAFVTAVKVHPSVCYQCQQTCTFAAECTWTGALRSVLCVCTNVLHRTNPCRCRRNPDALEDNHLGLFCSPSCSGAGVFVGRGCGPS